jgi:hypothetical protein
MKTVSCGCLVAALACVFSAVAWGQVSTSAPLAKELATALGAAKIDNIAAKDPASPDTYIGALYIPDVELVVISGRYSAPVLLDARLTKKEYKDLYLDLNGASMPGTKVLVEDVGADGLNAKRKENPPFDSFEARGKSTVFDGDWNKQKLSEEDYLRTFSEADTRYSQMLTALLAQLKKGS